MLVLLVRYLYMAIDRTQEDALRRLSVRQLEALATFIPMGERTGEYTTVEILKDSIYTADSENENKLIGGVISGLSKVKINKLPLILPAGRDEKEGMRWVLNPKVISREELKEILLVIPGLDI